ncbi:MULTISPECIES: hypothetical protein [Pseudomonas nitroreducens/multiresinivorans group]|uniref:Uncharacterized protein n=1 Tax=Pseudomonas multiresinivorans TaxID=95301 RepID=A0A7Z3GNP9_9PSED|nr:hypothetical protein [Pseudomonas multiresinivorans]QJP06335.1 hypothetical protein G4G71_00040 [Pseudomonas multiresinivorans]
MTLHRYPVQLLVTSQDAALARQVRALLAAYELPCAVMEGPTNCEQAPLCRWFKDAPLSDSARMLALLADAIGVLERTRHAFRSRELGELRQRLSGALQELSGPRPLV